MRPTCAASERPTSPPQGTDMVVSLATCHTTHMLKQGKGVHVESETGYSYTR